MRQEEKTQRDNNSDMLFDNLIWTVKEVAKYLGMSAGHIYNMKQKEEIPYKK